MLTEILLLSATFIGIIYIWLKYRYSYWTRHKVPHIPPTLLIGNLRDLLLFKCSPADFFYSLYNHKVAQDQPFIGMHVFHKPALLIREPELIKRILIKDFNKFSNRYSASDPHKDGLGGNNLFFLKNPAWKQIRAKITPVFTSGKMKQMFSLVDNIGKQLDDYLKKIPLDPKKNSACVELKEICALFTTDVIASTAFGVEANSIQNPEGDFRRIGRKIFKFTTYRAIEFTAMFFIPELVPILGFKVFSKESSDFIKSALNYVVNERERSGIARNDIIDVLIEMRKQSLKRHSVGEAEKNELKFDGDLMLAQAAVFFTAGFETSSSAMSFALYELSKKPELQTKLRKEIHETLRKNNDRLNYDSLQEMKYLNMVIQEVLRLYPPLPFLDRECTLPQGENSYSMEPFSDYEIPNGQPIYIPIYAIHKDPKYFPNPDEFDPERFSPENKDNIKAGTYMPFGIGPHNCIGERFGIMQAKIGLVHFFKNHFVKLSDKTPTSMKFDKKALIVQPEGGIYCEVHTDLLCN